MKRKKSDRKEKGLKKEVMVFRDMIGALYMEALKDGVISAEEKAILQQIEIGFKEYAKMVEIALEDGFISPIEADQLRKVQTKIMMSVANTAGADSIITDDEKALIKKLARYLLPQMSEINKSVIKKE
ncbi:MAG: hypothetical protein ACXADA_03680 [Candidatus Hodarchaeales archaeon]|jgi:tellurite resistance protein